MKCRLCNKEIILIPSAAERAAKYGGTAEFYTKLFTYHGECQIRKNRADAKQLMRDQNANQNTHP